MLKSFALKTAAALSPDGAKLNLLQRVRNLFKKIREIIRDENINTDEKEEQISQLLDAKEEKGTKPNIDMFGPKTYLVNKEIDEPEETKVSILNYLPQYKTTCLPSIGIEHVDNKMKDTIEYLSLEENKRIVTLIATKINEKYPDMAGFTPFKYASIKGTCPDIISIETKKKKEDKDFIKKRDALAMEIINGELKYLKYKDEDNQKEATEDDDKDLTAEIESLTINPDNGKESGGKRKTKRKNKKSKKSSRKKRKHRKTRKSKK